MLQRTRQRVARRNQENKPLDANKLTHGLWIGSAPPRGGTLFRSGFSLCVFCAKEIQPEYPGEYPGISVLNAPLRDDYPSEKEKMIAVSAAKFISNWIKDGKGNALVTCHLGLNRSGLVSAIAWKMLQPKKAISNIIHDMREARSEHVLCNEDFVDFLRSLEKSGPAYSYYVNPVMHRF